MNDNIEKNNSLFNKYKGEDIELDLNNENNSNNIKNKTIKIQSKNYECEEKDNKNRINDNYLKCSDCIINNALYQCSHCNKFYCQGCYDFISNFEHLNDHILIKIPENLLDNKIKQNTFLQNFIKLIKLYILKCNYILCLESLVKEFPFIKDEDINVLESQKNYLQNIYELCQYDENK